MKLKFKAITSEHFSCAGVNLKKGEVGDFKEEIAKGLLESFPNDFDLAEPETEKLIAPQSNKMAKKTVKFKSKIV